MQTASMTVAWGYLALAVTFLLVALAALFPRALRPHAASPLFFAAMVLTFYIPQWALLGALATGAAAYAGALGHWAGQVGLGVHVVAWSLLGLHVAQMMTARPVLDGTEVADDAAPFAHALGDEARAAHGQARVGLLPSFIFRTRAMRKVAVTRGVVYREVGGVRLRLDVYRPRDATGPLPALVYTHGGGWVLGTRRQSRFMLYELAAAGWVVFAVAYRFAPRHPLPAAVEDAKAAVAWIRANGAAHGARPDTLVAIGGSAGGHLAACLALTGNDPRFQPGFEPDDTRVQAAVVFYGVTDLPAAFRERPNPALALLLERVVVQARFAREPDRFATLSPASYVSAAAPPILLVHGQNDHLVPCAESHRFAQRLRAAGARTVHVLEVPLGQHAFEISPTPLHQRAVRVVSAFLSTVGPNRPPAPSPAAQA